jgi:S-DNA-T family DNA segregation ATPase FtsK/SpoIIIE
MELNENWNGEMEDLYKKALEIVKINKKCSVSFLQRKLLIGYAKGAKLQDMLEERGIIGKANGAKPRELLD